MNSLLKRRRYWEILPVLFLLVIISLKLSSISFNLMQFRAQHAGLLKFFIYSFILFSLSLLFFFDHWKELPLHKKSLLFSMSASIVCLNFNTYIIYQSSILFVVSSFIYLAVEKKVYKPNTMQVLFFVYFLLCTASLIWSSNKNLAINYLRNLSSVAYISILFCFFKLNREDFRMIFLFLFRFSMVFEFVSIISWLLEIHFLSFPIQQSLTLKKYSIGIYNVYSLIYAWSNHDHPTYNSLIILFSLATGWYYLFRKNVKNNISLFEFATFEVLTLVIAVISNSRFILLIWIIINIAGILFQVRKKTKLFTYLGLLFFISITFFLSAYRNEMNNFVKDPIRIFHYKVAVESIKKNPAIGTGYGGIPLNVEKEKPEYAGYQNLNPEVYKIKHPDNQILSDFMQTGLLGFLVIILMLSYPLYLSIKTKDWLLFMNSLFFLILMNIESPLMYVNGIFSFTILFNLLVNRNKNTKDDLF